MAFPMRGWARHPLQAFRCEAYYDERTRHAWCRVWTCRNYGWSCSDLSYNLGVGVSDFNWFGGRRWYWLHVTTNGHANRRSRAAEAATRVLKAAMAEIPGFHACVYYQAD